MRALSLPLAVPRLRAEGLGVPTLALSLGALTLAGLALRLTWVFYTDTTPLGGDPRWYYVVAVNVARGFGFVTSYDEQFLEVPGPSTPTAFWPPGYPLALAGVFKIFGAGFTAAKVFNALLGALTVPLVFLLGRALFHRGVGLLAAALFAVWPNAIAWTPLLFPEQLFTFLFVAALLVAVAFTTRSGTRWTAAAAFGALFGLALLTRGQAAVLVPVAGLYWLGRAGWRPAARATALALVAAAAVITPWTVRNWIELDAFVPVSTNSAAALRAGHAPGATGTTKWPDDRIDGFYMWESLRRPDWEVKGYREYTKRGLEYAFTHPGRELELAGAKVYHLHRSDSNVVSWLTTLGTTPIEPQALADALPRLFDYSYYLVVFLAVGTAPLWLRRDPERLLPLTTVAFWTLFHIVFLSEPRYHVPLYPQFAVAAAAGVWAAVTLGLGARSTWRARRPAGATVPR